MRKVDLFCHEITDKGVGRKKFYFPVAIDTIKISRLWENMKFWYGPMTHPEISRYPGYQDTTFFPDGQGIIDVNCGVT
jgi:hypothetical protein